MSNLVEHFESLKMLRKLTNNFFSSVESLQDHRDLLNMSFDIIINADEDVFKYYDVDLLADDVRAYRASTDADLH